MRKKTKPAPSPKVPMTADRYRGILAKLGSNVMLAEHRATRLQGQLCQATGEVNNAQALLESAKKRLLELEAEEQIQ